jgi:hypothetical protein
MDRYPSSFIFHGIHEGLTSSKILLKTIAEGNGLLRINNVVQWPQVAFNAGTNPAILSFQRGYLPLLSVGSIFEIEQTQL